MGQIGTDEVLRIVEDDLSGNDTRELLTLHLTGMSGNSPADHCHALDVRGLRAADVRVWSVWARDAIAGMGALRCLGNAGEVKSMRTHPNHLRRGVATALLEHIIGEARRRGYGRLSLETGSGPSFEPALALYRRRGFVDGPAFAGYRTTSFNQFLHLEL